MLEIDILEVTGMEQAIRSMRNPMNSWDKSDSTYIKNVNDEKCYVIGPNDLQLATNLVKGGPEHSKFTRMIQVYMDINAPLYWWKEMDTYVVGRTEGASVVSNSCSTMHKISEKIFTIDMFAHDHLNKDSINVLNQTIDILNFYREKYLLTDDKRYWWQMIQLLPSSYLQKRTLMLSYQTLNNIYKQRKNHKLDEWRIDFIKVLKVLPYSKELIVCKH